VPLPIVFGIERSMAKVKGKIDHSRAFKQTEASNAVKADWKW